MVLRSHVENFQVEETTIPQLVENGLVIRTECTLAARSFSGWCLYRQSYTRLVDLDLVFVIMILVVRVDDLATPIADQLFSVT